MGREEQGREEREGHCQSGRPGMNDKHREGREHLTQTLESERLGLTAGRL